MKSTSKAALFILLFLAILLPLILYNVHGTSVTQLLRAKNHSRPLGKYPEHEDKLKAMLVNQDVQGMRAHAWAILSHNIDPRYPNNPLWEGSEWEGKCTLGLVVPPCPTNAPFYSLGKWLHTKLYLENAFQLKTKLLGEQKQFQVSSVLYNAAAVTFIKDKNHPLAEVGTWQDLLANDKQLHFPEQALVVKEIWEAIPACDQQSPGCLPPYIKVWSDIVKNNATSTWPTFMYPPVPSWTDSVLYVNTDTSAKCDKNRVYPIVKAVSRPGLADRIPINCFHWIPVSPLDPKIVPDNHQIPSVSSSWIPKTNYFLLLVGLHVATAELPNWVWSTFWWTNDPHSDRSAQDQPATIADSAPWSFFSMNTTMSMVVPRATDLGPDIIYNPYLEGANENGPVSNCLYCHQRAIYRQGKQHVDTDILNASHASPQRCAFIAPQTPGCQPLPSDAYFDNAIRTNFLWSLAIHQDQIANEDTPGSEVK